MAAIIFYPASDCSQFSSSNLSFNEPTFFLHWSTSTKSQIDPLKVQPIYCGSSSISFSHLKAPLIFIEDGLNISNDSFTNLLRSQQAAKLFCDSGQGSRQFRGILLIQNPGIIEITSFASFRIWIEQRAESINSILLL